MTTFVKADDVEWQTGLYIKHVQKRQTHEPNPWAWTIWGDLWYTWKEWAQSEQVEFMREDAEIIASLQINYCQCNISITCHKPSPMELPLSLSQTPTMQKREEAPNYTFNLLMKFETVDGFKWMQSHRFWVRGKAAWSRWLSRCTDETNVMNVKLLLMSRLE